MGELNISLEKLTSISFSRAEINFGTNLYFVYNGLRNDLPDVICGRGEGVYKKAPLMALRMTWKVFNFQRVGGRQNAIIEGHYNVDIAWVKNVGKVIVPPSEGGKGLLRTLLSKISLSN